MTEKDDSSVLGTHPHHPQNLPLGQLVPSPIAQRRFISSWAAELANHFDLDDMGRISVNNREDVFYIIDGQHRAAALKIIGFKEVDLIPCEVYKGLSEEEEAELFLRLNHSKNVGAYDTFDKAVKARRMPEIHIDHVVRSQGLSIGRVRGNGAISAVVSLKKTWDRLGAIKLGMLLRIIRDAYGPAGFEGPVIEGLGLCLHRYDGMIEEEAMTERLANASGALNGLLQPATKAYFALGQPKVQCIAAQAAIIYNHGQKTGKKLAAWWTE